MSATVNTRTIDWQAIAGTIYGGTLDVEYSRKTFGFLLLKNP